MADEVVVEKVSKGGECWLEISLDRKATGLEIWTRADPRVESFMESLSEEDRTPDALEVYGKQWLPIDPEHPILVRRLMKEIESPIYTINAVCLPLTSSRAPGNVSFLRFVGVGSAEGVRFRIVGPISRDAIRTMKDNILSASRQLFRDYIVPTYINLRVTSTEL